MLKLFFANLDKILEFLHRSDKNTRPALCFLSPPLRVLSHNFTILEEKKNLKNNYEQNSNSCRP